jgi:hypothetical protein
MGKTTLKSDIFVTPQDILASSATALTDLGIRATTGDSRYFRYMKVGSLATVPGMVYQGPAQDTTNLNPSGGLTPYANAAIGATSVTINDSITNVVDVVAGGYMTVAVTPGQGYTYKIKGNTAVTGAAGMVVTLEDPLVIAITTSSNVNLYKNPFSGIVVAPATMTNSIVGVPTNIFTALYYAWIQVAGPCSCLQTGTGTCGTALGFLQGGTEGSLAPAIAGTPILAWALGTNVTGEYGLVDLKIS